MVAPTGSRLYRRLATGVPDKCNKTCVMSEPSSNPGLDRVQHELLAKGVPKETPNPLRSGVHSRGYLPHVKREGASYFVTFRLVDSLPQEVLLKFKQQQAEKLRALTETNQFARDELNREYHRQIERYLDLGAGKCHLKNPAIARMVAEAVLHFHEDQYLLDEWVVMPNHLHLILWPKPNHTLSAILSSRKRQTARQANLILGTTGMPFWQHESYDHWIRNDEEKAQIQRYIRNNPVTAKLCSTPEAWPWGSAAYSK